MTQTDPPAEYHVDASAAAHANSLVLQSIAKMERERFINRQQWLWQLRQERKQKLAERKNKKRK